jgi:Ser/Thr protein kinase RdoA (MazF antagonist)
MNSARPTLETVQELARQFGADPADLKLINAGFNTVYRAGTLALRLTGEARKDLEYLNPPLAWLRHLHAAGAPVCEPVSTPDGRWVVALQQGDQMLLATAVRWVEGPRLSELPATPQLYRAYGESIGRLHRANDGFELPPGTRHMLDPGEDGVFARWDWLWLRAAQHIQGYGVLERAFERLTPLVLAWQEQDQILTHGDLRPGNVIWNEPLGRAVVIDFDEPVLGPAALDLARADLEVEPSERPNLFSALLAGYRSVRPLGPIWDERLPDLMAARAALMTAWSAEDGNVGPASGSGAVVSADRLLQRLELWDF